MNAAFPLGDGVTGDLAEPSEALHTNARYQRGIELWRLGLEQEAHAEFEVLRQELWQDPWPLAQLAVDVNALGLYDVAIRSARQVLDLAGNADSTQGPRLLQRLRFPTPFLNLVESAGASSINIPSRSTARCGSSPSFGNTRSRRPTRAG